MCAASPDQRGPLRSPGIEDLTLKMWFIFVVGWAVTFLTTKTCLSFWNQDFKKGVLWFALGSVLAFVFFRRRKIALAFIALTYILVSTGLTAVFHPSVLGTSLVVGSVICLYLLIRWTNRRFPNLGPMDWRILLDKDPEP